MISNEALADMDAFLGEGIEQEAFNAKASDFYADSPYLQFVEGAEDGSPSDEAAFGNALAYLEDITREWGQRTRDISERTPEDLVEALDQCNQWYEKEGRAEQANQDFPVTNQAITLPHLLAMSTRKLRAMEEMEFLKGLNEYRWARRMHEIIQEAI